MSLFSLSFAGGALLLIGAWESLISTPSSSSSQSPPQKPHPSPFRHSTVTLLATAALSLIFSSYAAVALLDAASAPDPVGVPLQLQFLAVSALFLLFSLLGLLSNLSTLPSLSFPYPLINLVLLLAFVEEFLIFYLQRKDPSGVENRYFDLMLLPISVCVVSTMIELKSPDSNMPRLARGIGLISQGAWLIQMGFSFFSDWLVRNCGLHQRSWGNYTIKCKGHMDDHRGKAIAVLLFNCHLAFLVTVIVIVYSVVGAKNVREYTRYRALGAEMQMVDQSQFSLDSDEEEGGNVKNQGNSGDMSLRSNGHGHGHGASRQ